MIALHVRVPGYNPSRIERRGVGSWSRFMAVKAKPRGGTKVVSRRRARVQTSRRANVRRDETLGDRLMKFAGTAPGLPHDLARNHDHYIHGAPKK